MSNTGTNAELYRRWLADLWNGDLDTLEHIAAELVTPDFVGHWPGRPASVRGPEALAATIREGRLPFAPLTFTPVVGPVIDDTLVAARWAGRGTYAGGDHAIPGVTAPAGTPVEFHGHDILRVRDGRFVEYWSVSEGEHLMNQLSAH
ncbi:nuclear transport factor 2 family protein [Spiractinospora alimapuensis]|uniref:ester cyclase n=1 Tax=Spiractinospora alimapuensis TaxID=2820884 RepID=UPI001F3D5D34|nr:nuclear transport factor 2 family protein [Spiractinospora alimapuensis]QVQ52097.1 nuclear transport factor 2 family protein [Spiractinospora alimapuensis]